MHMRVARTVVMPEIEVLQRTAIGPVIADLPLPIPVIDGIRAIGIAFAWEITTAFLIVELRPRAGVRLLLQLAHQVA
jgi:hypothetical protein